MKMMLATRLFAVTALVVVISAFRAETVEAYLPENHDDPFRQSSVIAEQDNAAALPDSGSSPVDIPVEAAAPGFAQFVAEVSGAPSNALKGIYVEGILALSVVQQPPRQDAFVSEELGEVTQFRKAAENGVTGLMAHNYLSGILFYSLLPGHEIKLVYGNGRVRCYRVRQIYEFQRLPAPNLRGNFINVSTEDTWSAARVFRFFYQDDDRLVLQTCLEKDGKTNWGLRFITADPVEEEQPEIDQEFETDFLCDGPKANPE